MDMAKQENKKNDSKYYILSIPIYNQGVFVVINGNLNDALYLWRKAKKKIKVEHYKKMEDYIVKTIKETQIKETTSGTLFIDCPVGYILTIKSVNINTIAHEATHLTQYVLEKAGICANKSAGYKETFAYLNGFIIEELYSYSKSML
jgi:hypothetical protein